MAVEPVEPVAWPSSPSSPWRGRRARRTRGVAVEPVEPVAWPSSPSSPSSPWRGAVPCFQFANATNGRGETQQNFKITYSKRNNILRTYLDTQFCCVPNLKNETTQTKKKAGGANPPRVLTVIPSLTNRKYPRQYRQRNGRQSILNRLQHYHKPT